MENISSKDYLTIEEVSEMLHLKVSTVRRLIREGSLPAYRPGNRLIIRRQDIDAYVLASPRAIKEETKK